MTLDRPDFKTGSPNIDDGWIKDTIRSLLPMLKRNVIVMEVRFFQIFCPFATAVGFQVINNFIPEFRKEAFSEFPDSRFSKRVLVAIGQPPAEFVARQR